MFKDKFSLVGILFTTLLLSSCAGSIQATKVTPVVFDANTKLTLIEEITNNQAKGVQPYVYKFVEPLNKYGVILKNHIAVQFYYSIQHAETIEVVANPYELDYYRSYFQKNKINNVSYSTTLNEKSYVITSRFSK